MGLRFRGGLRSSVFVFDATSFYVVCYTAVFSVVTQRSSPRALRDDTKNGYVALFMRIFKFLTVFRLKKCLSMFQVTLSPSDGLTKDTGTVNQPRPQGFSLKKMGGAHPFFEGKALGTRLTVNQYSNINVVCMTPKYIPKWTIKGTGSR